MNSENNDAERVRLNGSLAFWEQMLAQLDVDARALNRLVFGSPLAIAVAFVVMHSWQVVLGVVALVAAVWSMGRYMIGVRRVEYRYHISDIQRQLRNQPK